MRCLSVRPTRAAGLLGVFAALLALAFLSGATAAAEPLIRPDEMLPVSEIRPGMKAVGKTVFEGTKVEDFGLTILGVMLGADFGSDMILARIDSGPVVTKNFGVIAGMSGSPIYVNGKIIGALAFTWTFLKQPLVGITPIAAMIEDYQPGAVPPAARTGTLRAREPIVTGGQRFDRALVAPNPAAVRTEAGVATLTPIATPLMVSGLPPAALSRLEDFLRPHNVRLVVGPGRATQPVTTPLVPGSALAVRLIGGDVDISAVGTVTYIKGNNVLAFGHPFFSLGDTAMPMSAAYVHGIVSTWDISFKMASGAQNIGTIRQDRAAGIGGVLGETPPEVPARFTITDLDRQRTVRYNVSVAREKTLTPLLLMISFDGAVYSVGPADQGSLRVAVDVEAEGLPPIHRENSYSSGGAQLPFYFFFGFGGNFPQDELMELLNTLQNNPFGPAKLKRVAVRVEMSQHPRTAVVERVWTDVKIVRPGDQVDIHALIQPYDEPKRTETVTVTVPAGASAGPLRIGVGGGKTPYMVKERLGVREPQPRTLAQMVEQVVQRERNNDLLTVTAPRTMGIEAGGRRLTDLPVSVIEVLNSANATRLNVLRDFQLQRRALPWVLSGGEVLTLLVETDEQDKAGRALVSEAGYEPYAEVGMLFRGLFGAGSMGLKAQRSRLPLPRRANDEPAPEESPDAESEPSMPSFEELESMEPSDFEMMFVSGAGSAASRPRGPSIARPPTIWTQTTEKDFQAGHDFGTAILAAGGVTLAPTAKTLYQSSQDVLWATAVDHAGNVFLGTWMDGRLLKVTPDGVGSVFYQSPEVALQALVCDEAGNLYAGGAPGGHIYRITPAGQATVFASLPETYIWALTFDASGRLYAATGTSGRLYRISPEGKPELLFTAPDRHLIAMARGPAGDIYVATYPRGKVYRVGSDGKVSAVFESPKTAIQSLALDKQGNLYVGATPQAVVYKVTPAGVATEFFKTKGRHILSLAADETGNIYAAVGPRASIYRLAPDGTATLLYDTKTPYIPQIALVGGDLYATTAGNGRLLRLALTGGGSGYYESAIFDAGATAAFGTVNWRAEVPEGASVALQTRSGDTAHPDETWSGWSAPYATTGTPVTSPRGRYAQFRANLEAKNSGRPVIHGVEMFLMPQNRPPTLTLTQPKPEAIWSGTKSVSWSAQDPDRDKLVSTAYYSADRGKTWVEIKKAEGKEEEGAATGAGKPAPTQPTAADPEIPPELRQALEEAAASEEPTPTEEGAVEETPEEKPAETPANSISWDTQKVADGVYRIKVVTTDKRSNPQDPLTVERISQEFVVDNTPPDLIVDKGRSKTDPPPQTIAAYDPTIYVASAEYRADEGEWIAAVARDGIFDSHLETLVLDLKALPAGAHTLEVKVRDGAGNETTVKIPYSIPGGPAAPTPAPKEPTAEGAK